ncbi:MAG TPA: hypothetical protein VMG60_03045 [Burkholderiaceae bacterium]|nr:hypothetical protein [Burkholderiaceae bacterium]
MPRLPAAMGMALCCLAAMPAAAPAADKETPATPRADFHPVCPFTIAAPAVLSVRDARRWQSVLGATRSATPPYEAGATNFKHESVVIVVLPYSTAPVAQAGLNASRPERFDADTGTLTLWYDVKYQEVKPGETVTPPAGEPCLVTWVAVRTDLQQIVARTSEGRYIAGTRTAEKPKKKP